MGIVYYIYLVLILESVLLHVSEICRGNKKELILT